MLITLDKLEPRPLTQEESERFMKMYLCKEDMEKPLGDDAEAREMFLAKILLKRIEAYKLRFKMTNFFFLASVVTFADNPGKAMLLLRECYNHNKKYGNDLFDIDTWAHMFPDGVPTEESMSKAWDLQKCEPGGWAETDNTLDKPDTWKYDD